MAAKKRGECLCGELFCEQEHPDEEEFVRLSKKEAPGILKRLKAGLELEPLDLTVLRVAGKRAPRWKDRKR